MKVLLTKKFFESDLNYIENRIDSSISLIQPPEYTESAVISLMKDADVLFGGMLTEKIFREAQGSIKFFQIPWTGVDNVDFELMEKYGVTACNSHSNSDIVAEHAVSMMLSIAKKLPYHDRQMRQGNWNRVSSVGNSVSPFSKSVKGSRVMILGYGAIGKSIDNFLAGFECEISIVSRSGVTSNSLSARQKIYDIGSLEATLPLVDFIFVCIPLTEDTRGLFDDQMFDRMNANVIFINVSRGDIVDESALFRALKDKKIAGAAIDTWYNHPTADNNKPSRLSENKFEKLDNLLMSPHRAGYIESEFPHLDDAIENLNRYVRKKGLINVLSFDKKY